MTLIEYLNDVLKSQTLAEDSEELERLRAHRQDVEALLRNAFAESSPTIRYGGSVVKKTLIKDDYDLDIVCYFGHDDDGAGDNLREIFNNVSVALSKQYFVQQKKSALRLKGKGETDYLQDFHIDVVPGRFTDDSRSDCYIHQAGGEKSRLKTNIDTHIKHIRDSGLTPIIRVMKLWNVHNGMGVKTFVLELATVAALSGRKNASLGDQFKTMLTLLSDDAYSIHVEDPANPTGNDLSGALDDGLRLRLSAVAASTLSHINDGNFGKLFGEVDTATEKSVPLVSVVSSVGEQGSRPWSR